MRKSRKFLVIIAIVGLSLTLAGISYAYLRVRKSQEDDNNLSTLSCLGVTISNTTSGISLAEAYPISDEEGLKTTSYKFSVSNKCNTIVNAQINLETLTITDGDALDPNYVKVWFNNANLDNPKLAILNNTEVFKDVPTTLSDATQSNKLMDIQLDEYESEDFELKMWLDEATSTAQGLGKKYKGKITVTVSPNPNTAVTKGDLTIYAYINGTISDTFPTSNDYTVETECSSFSNNNSKLNMSASWTGSRWSVSVKNLDSGESVCNVRFKTYNYPAPDNWFNSKDNTLLAAIKTANNISSPSTLIGSEASSSTEKVLASTQDDYGTSFYFRGAVENNYVEFAGMCWRIVRITGDGSIKIVLYNRNDSNSSTPCADATATGNAFAKYDGTNTTSAFNANATANTNGQRIQYIGFMYGSTLTTGSDLERFSNNIDSTIFTNLKTWYNSKLRDYNSKLADVIWCNDKNYSASKNYSQFAGMTRLYDGTPTLKCEDSTIDGANSNLSRFTVAQSNQGNGKLTSGGKEYKIGLLTGDEVVYAGAGNSKSAATNTTYYLYKNTGNAWWTMTPAWYNGANYYNANIVSVNASGVLISAQPDLGVTAASRANSTLSVRPAIALKKDTTITQGTGTAENPYKIS